MTAPNYEAQERRDPAQREAALHALGERFNESPRAAYRSYQEQATRAQCALVAQLHNSTTAEQRAHARGKLLGWAEDARVLAAEQPAR